MTMKITVSLPDELVLRARAAVQSGHAESVSAYVAEALAEKSRQERLVALLDELDAELGPPGDDAVAWADDSLRVAHR